MLLNFGFGEDSWTARRSTQSTLKENSPEYSLEGLMLKLQYIGHLMWRTDSMEKTLILGMIEGRRRRGRQRMRWLDGITDLMNMSLSKLKLGVWWWTGKSGMLQSMGALNWTDALIWLSGASPVLCISELCDIPDLEFSIWWPTTHQTINGLNQIYLPGLCQRSHPILLHSIPNVGILFYLQRLDICLCCWSSFITYTIYILFPPMQIFILNFPRNILPCGSDSKETACNGRDPGSVPGLGRCLDKGMATHSSILSWRLPMDRGAWQARVHGVTKSWTRWSEFTSLHVEIREFIGHRWYFERL